MDRTAKLKDLRRRVAQAKTPLEKSEAEDELANASADAKDDERLSSVSVGLLPLVEQLAVNAVEPMMSWTQCVRVAAHVLQDVQRAKKEGTAIDPDRLAAQAEELIEALTRLQPR